MRKCLNDDLASLTGKIVASYETDVRTHRIGQMFLPSRSRIVELLDELRQLLFPGYFGRKRLTRENVHFHVGNLLSRLGEDLSEQINHCMCASRD